MSADPQNNSLGVVIGAREIYDQLVGLRADVQGLTQANVGTADTLEDHEDRLRNVERWKYAIAPAAISAIVSAGVTLFGKSG